MTKYYIDYEDKCGDLSHIWVYADSVSEAKVLAKREHWDISDILNVRKV